jgi:peptide chain release factor 1
MHHIPDLDPFRKRLGELEQELADPDIFKDQRRAASLSREHRRIVQLLALGDEIKTTEKTLSENRLLLDDEELGEMAAEEIEALEAKLKEVKENLLLYMIPAEEADERNTIIEIRAGTGGEEASLFASDLLRMYSRYAEESQWNVERLSESLSETGGYKEVIFSVKGEDVFARLKFESGVHRVQRVPTTEANGRIHTSTATVAVLPEAEEVDIEIDPNDLEINVCRASGPGGQGVNTTDSAVQLLHKPTGLTVYCADERSQLKNKNKAMTVLRARLLNLKQEEEREKYAANRRRQIGTGDRSERIRTYNFPQSRMTDHRIGHSTRNLAEVMDGGLNELLDALIEEDRRLRLEEISASQGS